MSRTLLTLSLLALIAVASFGATRGATSAPSPELTHRAVAYEHGGVQLEGYLVYDASRVSADHPAPGVAVYPEWWGLNDYAKQRAEKLAQLGYVAFAVDMYGKGVVTAEAAKAGELAGQFYGKPLMAERARAGLDQLLASGLVDPDRVAAIGYCFGGSITQALAYSGAPLAGIVSFHGGLIPASPEAAQKNRAKILICHGAVDPLVKPEDLAAFTKGLNDGGFDYQFISYSGARHAFTNPGVDALAKANGMEAVVGYDAAADRRSWGHMRQFFAEIFATE
ncbi:MAG: dienelactone hydrolase family protein [Planctomycetes bacterium]|nr:dienelactone hydrolase family protein [Planctomycetota bacterium]MCB9903770.1 dienelactone hydrolase family protein [Planctomycetota bacterium]